MVGGAKSYSYKTKYGCTKKGKVQVTQKGITLDMANDEVINFDTMKDMVLNTTLSIESKRDSSSNGTLTQRIYSQNMFQEVSNQQ